MKFCFKPSAVNLTNSITDEQLLDPEASIFDDGGGPLIDGVSCAAADDSGS